MGSFFALLNRYSLLWSAFLPLGLVALGWGLVRPAEPWQWALMGFATALVGVGSGMALLALWRGRRTPTPLDPSALPAGPALVEVYSDY